jgi:TrpR-related protein YerC/YecD
MEDRIRTKDVDMLLKAFAAIDNPDDIYALLQDLCTVREIQDMSQRLVVAKLLSKGEHYSAIQEATGISATTISRVSKALNYGADGYRIALDVLGDDATSDDASDGDAGTAAAASADSDD